ncbi:gamma carbonic anhydrase family protein [Microlunatus capsulatus]|uniref:Carbonic anhydrase/acetyltransferase-like protein (Isoleucine patch superfamily) n=1 Tax=Microlunatus capsulatus TaxID=99117 RepID=A0ABS4Z8A5_9ACTN|nr:gamma carbonic anhydrase family protein [Microlunatus capsulatus]MBP2416937.1 carbonic anhydrase/acetyltransferase-like protein (isoleucine patch superfamily) [Microlunatus capsulatus]
MSLRPLVLPYEGLEPQIDPTAWLAPNATVVGDAHVGAQASIFYGAVVRADMAAVRLGAGSNLQDNVVVHTDTDLPALIGAGVTVGHAAVVHGCVVEDRCLIGMNATVLNGAVVGAGSLVAAGAVVREGAVIPPRSLVAGVPGRVLRPLTDDEHARVVAGAAVYVDLAARHRAALAGS